MAKKKIQEHELEKVSLGELKPHPKNYKGHPDDQVEHIKQSMKENGIFRNIVIANDNVILAGHGIAKASLELGLKSIYVTRMSFDSNDPRALKILVADNEITRLAVVDDRLLTEVLKEIQKDDDLFGTGFDDMMLANLVFVSRGREEIEDFEEAEEWVGMPEYEGEPEPLTVVVKLQSEEDRDKLGELLGIEFEDKHKNIEWWPPKERDDISSIRID